VDRLIRVELKDGSICRMAIKAFNLFLAQGKIVKFQRADGWVTVGVDPLRKMTQDSLYNGPERRIAV
jgi:hypothetical protein